MVTSLVATRPIGTAEKVGECEQHMYTADQQRRQAHDAVAEVQAGEAWQAAAAHHQQCPRPGGRCSKLLLLLLLSSPLHGDAPVAVRHHTVAAAGQVFQLGELCNSKAEGDTLPPVVLLTVRLTAAGCIKSCHDAAAALTVLMLSSADPIEVHIVAMLDAYRSKYAGTAGPHAAASAEAPAPLVA